MIARTLQGRYNMSKSKTGKSGVLNSAILKKKIGMNTKCIHTFVATSEKGRWTVKVQATNGRGSARDETIATTVFKCSDCGEMHEYPDSWEKNYIVSDLHHARRKTKGDSGANQ